MANSSAIGLAAPARGEQQRGVVGRGRAVDVERVEGRVGRRLQRLLQDRTGHVGIGGEEGEHGRHVGGDHPAALGHPAEREGRAADDDFLGLVIGRQDAAGRVMPALGRELPRQVRDVAQDRLHRQRRADDPGRADHDVTVGDLQRFAGRRGHQLRVLVAGLAGPGIGVARVDDHRRGLAAVGGERGAIELDRGSDELVLGEHPGARHRLQVLGREQRHVELAPLDTRMAAGSDEPLAAVTLICILPTIRGEGPHEVRWRGSRKKAPPPASPTDAFGVRSCAFRHAPGMPRTATPLPANAGEDVCGDAHG